MRTGQDSRKKSQSDFAYLERSPTVPTETKICMKDNLPDVIMCAKFQDEILEGYKFTGRRISHFPIEFCMGLTTMQ